MNGFTPEQLSQLKQAVREAVKEELADAGLRLDDADHQDEAREDFRFLRRIRKTFDGAATQVGRSILLALLAVFGVIFGLGFWQWIGRQ